MSFNGFCLHNMASEFKKPFISMFLNVITYCQKMHLYFLKNFVFKKIICLIKNVLVLI